MNNLRKLPNSVWIHQPLRLLSRHGCSQLRSVRFLYNHKIIEENRQRKLAEKETAKKRIEQREQLIEERRQQITNKHHFRLIRVPLNMRKYIQLLPPAALMMALNLQTTIPELQYWGVPVSIGLYILTFRVQHPISRKLNGITDNVIRENEQIMAFVGFGAIVSFIFALLYIIKTAPPPEECVATAMDARVQETLTAWHAQKQFLVQKLKVMEKYENGETENIHNYFDFILTDKIGDTVTSSDSKVITDNLKGYYNALVIYDKLELRSVSQKTPKLKETVLDEVNQLDISNNERGRTAVLGYLQELSGLKLNQKI